MSKPNFNEERKLWKKGVNFVVGIDEAGRGPLAGPVIACAITIPEFPISNFQFPKNVKDSKKLSAKKREEIYKLLKKNPDVKWGIGRVSEKIIDKINILQATKLAMRRAVKNLSKKGTGFLSAERNPVPFLLIDGNFGIDLDFPQKSIIKGDQKVFSCAAASIIAKVSRDRMMIKYHDKYPEYGFNRHKGYGTKLHREAIKKYGFCDIHRKTFRVS